MKRPATHLYSSESMKCAHSLMRHHRRRARPFGKRRSRAPGRWRAARPSRSVHCRAATLVERIVRLTVRGRGSRRRARRRLTIAPRPTTACARRTSGARRLSQFRSPCARAAVAAADLAVPFKSKRSNLPPVAVLMEGSSRAEGLTPQIELEPLLHPFRQLLLRPPSQVITTTPALKASSASTSTRVSQSSSSGVGCYS